MSNKEGDMFNNGLNCGLNWSLTGSASSAPLNYSDSSFSMSDLAPSAPTRANSIDDFRRQPPVNNQRVFFNTRASLGATRSLDQLPPFLAPSRFPGTQPLYRPPTSVSTPATGSNTVPCSRISESNNSQIYNISGEYNSGTGINDVHNNNNLYQPANAQRPYQRENSQFSSTYLPYPLDKSGSSNGYYSNHFLPSTYNCIRPIIEGQFTQNVNYDSTSENQSGGEQLMRQNYRPEEIVQMTTTIADTQERMLQLISKIQDRMPPDLPANPHSGSSDDVAPINPPPPTMHRKGLISLIPRHLLPFRLDGNMTIDNKMEKIYTITAICNSAIVDGHVTTDTVISQFMLVCEGDVTSFLRNEYPVVISLWCEGLAIIDSLRRALFHRFIMPVSQADSILRGVIPMKGESFVNTISRLKRLTDFVESPTDRSSLYNLRSFLKRNSITVAVAIQPNLRYAEMLSSSLVDLAMDSSARVTAASYYSQQIDKPTSSSSSDPNKPPCGCCGSQYHGENNCFIRYPAKKAEYLANKAKRTNPNNRQHYQQEATEEQEEAQFEAQHVQFAPAVPIPGTIRGRYDLLLAEASENLRKGRSSITNEMLLAMLHDEIPSSSSSSNGGSPDYSVGSDNRGQGVSRVIAPTGATLVANPPATLVARPPAARPKAKAKSSGGYARAVIIRRPATRSMYSPSPPATGDAASSSTHQQHYTSTDSDQLDEMTEEANDVQYSQQLEDDNMESYDPSECLGDYQPDQQQNVQTDYQMTQMSTQYPVLILRDRVWQSSREDKRLLYATVKVNGQPVRAMLDSGSTFNSLSLQAATALGLTINPNNIISFYSSTNMAQSIGTAEAIIQTATTSSSQLFHVTQEHSIPVLLGVDVMRRSCKNLQIVQSQLVSFDDKLKEVLELLRPSIPLRIVKNFVFKLGTIINTTPEQVTIKKNMSVDKLKSLEKFITDSLSLGVIEVGVLGDWLHHLLPVIHYDKNKKPDGNRWCGNLIKVNRHFEKLPTVVPTTREIIDNLQRFRFKALVDIKSAFWSLPLLPQQRHYFGFVCALGTFRWTRAPFGFINSPSNQQHIIQQTQSAKVVQRCSRITVDF